jgi:hypothetical protein
LRYIIRQLSFFGLPSGESLIVIFARGPFDYAFAAATASSSGCRTYGVPV